MWDNQIGLPMPPLNAIAPAGFSLGCAIFYSLLAFGVFLYSLNRWRTSGRPVMIILLVSGGLTVLVEPYLDLIGACWHPRFGQTVVFQFLGRPIPCWMISAYFAYFGGMGSLNCLVFSRGVTSKTIRLWFLIPMLFDVIIEEVMLHEKLYIYYGAQPLILVGKLPLWWVPCNSLGEFIGVSLAVIAAPLLRGWRLLFLLLVFPLGDATGYALAALPSVIAINAPAPYWIDQFAGVLTFLLACLAVHCLSLVLAIDSPMRWRTGASCAL